MRKRLAGGQAPRGPGRAGTGRAPAGTGGSHLDRSGPIGTTRVGLEPLGSDRNRSGRSIVSIRHLWRGIGTVRVGLEPLGRDRLGSALLESDQPGSTRHGMRETPIVTRTRVCAHAWAHTHTCLHRCALARDRRHPCMPTVTPGSQGHTHSPEAGTRVYLCALCRVYKHTHMCMCAHTRDPSERAHKHTPTPVCMGTPGCLCPCEHTHNPPGCAWMPLRTCPCMCTHTHTEFCAHMCVLAHPWAHAQICRYDGHPSEHAGVDASVRVCTDR